MPTSPTSPADAAPRRPPRGPSARTLLRAVLAVVGLLLVLPLGGCGTRVVEDSYVVSVADPSGRLGAPPVQVGVFDSAMGQGREWAARTQGTTSPGSPYTATVSSTVTRMVLDNSLPTTVRAGVTLPGYAADGWFSVQVPVTPGAEQRITLPYLPYGAPGASGAPGESRPAPLPAVLSVEEGDRGWTVRLLLEIPSG